MMHPHQNLMLTDKTLKYDHLLRSTTFPPASTTQFRLDEDEDSFENLLEKTDTDDSGADTPFANNFLDAPDSVNNGTVFHETNTVFADRFDGTFSQAKKLSVRLLGYVYGEIMDIMDARSQSSCQPFGATVFYGTTLPYC
jgi:hypothetical protein